jgi:transposase
MKERDREAPKNKRGPGRPPKFDEEALATIKEIVIENPTAPIAELRGRIEAATGVSATRATIKKALDSLGIVRVVPPVQGRRQEASSPAPREKAPYGYREEHRTSAPSARHTLGVSDAEWELVQHIFVDKVRGRARKYERRDMLDAMLYVLRGGIAWRLLPAEYPPWHLVFKTYKRWQAQGRFEAAMQRLRRMWREREGRNAEPTGAVLDSQSVATSAQGGPKGYDAGKKIKGRKRHILTDTLGLVLAVVVSTANVQDRDAAEEVVAAGKSTVPTIQRIYADSAYAGTCKDRLEAHHEGLTVEIVRRSDNRNVGQRLPKEQALLFDNLDAPPRGFVVLPKRWVIERTNGWNLRARRMTRDQDRSIESAEGWIWLASMRRLLGRLSRPSDA